MAVRVRMFAALREAAGESEVAMAPGELGELLDALRQRYEPPFADVLACCTVLVDGQATRSDTKLVVADGTEVALLPPVSGGSAVAPRPP